jgi:hypothetical protein
MGTHEKVMEFINLVKGHKNHGTGYDAHEIIERVYKNGNCYMFAKTLQFIFPQAEIYSVDCSWFSHVVAKIDGKLYDITGEVSDEYSYSPISKEEEEDARTWCYSTYLDGAYGLHDQRNNPIEKLSDLRMNATNTGWDIESCLN